MRKPFIAGNWKMNKTVAETRHLVSELVPMMQVIEGVDKVICPPFISLLATAALLEGSDIGLGAQNLYWELSGAYTGEISAQMIAEFCQFVIVGHSERRMYFGETDEGVNRKIQTALAHGLTPIVCVGETLQENEAGQTIEIVSNQVLRCLAGIKVTPEEAGANTMVVAYEPVWAIGTGRAATVADARTVIGEVIRPTLRKLFDDPAAEYIRILYGGSVNGDNAAEFFNEPDIDGALVGGASLKAGDFTRIIQAAAN